LERNRPLETLPFQDKRILELGSGVGMLGMSLLKTLPMKEFIFTDCHFKAHWPL
jgi:16S rRNA G1207 methylase RsmC